MTGVPAGPLPELFAAALREFTAGKLPRADALCRQILAAEPRHADSWRLLGKIASQAGRNEAAIGPFEKALSLNPNYAEVHGELGIAFMELSRLDQATACFQRVLALNPNLPEGHY